MGDGGVDKSALRQEVEGGSGGSRLETNENVDEGDNELVDEMVNTRKEIKDGGETAIVGVRDVPMSAFLATLERDEFERERIDLGKRLLEATGRDPDRYDNLPKSDLIRLLHEAALNRVAPDVLDQIAEAGEKYDEWEREGSTGIR